MKAWRDGIQLWTLVECILLVEKNKKKSKDLIKSWHDQSKRWRSKMEILSIFVIFHIVCPS